MTFCAVTYESPSEGFLRVLVAANKEAENMSEIQRENRA